MSPLNCNQFQRGPRKTAFRVAILHSGDDHVTAVYACERQLTAIKHVSLLTSQVPDRSVEKMYLHVGNKAFFYSPAVGVNLVQKLQLVVVISTHSDAFGSQVQMGEFLSCVGSRVSVALGGSRRRATATRKYFKRSSMSSINYFVGLSHLVACKSLNIRGIELRNGKFTVPCVVVYSFVDAMRAWRRHRRILASLLALDVVHQDGGCLSKQKYNVSAITLATLRPSSLSKGF